MRSPFRFRVTFVQRIWKLSIVWRLTGTATRWWLLKHRTQRNAIRSVWPKPIHNQVYIYGCVRQRQNKQSGQSDRPVVTKSEASNANKRWTRKWSCINYEHQRGNYPSQHHHRHGHQHGYVVAQAVDVDKHVDSRKCSLMLVSNSVELMTYTNIQMYSLLFINIIAFMTCFIFTVILINESDWIFLKRAVCLYVCTRQFASQRLLYLWSFPLHENFTNWIVGFLPLFPLPYLQRRHQQVRLWWYVCYDDLCALYTPL